MSLITPTPGNDYFFNDETPLDPDTLNLIFSSISERLKAQEAEVADYHDAIETLNQLGVQMLSQNLAPQLMLAQDQLNELQRQSELINDYLAPLRNGVVVASSVSVGAISGLSATNVQAALAELQGAVAANATALSTFATALGSFTFASVRPFAKKTASFNAVAYWRYRCETGSSAFTATLPASPADGTVITFRRRGPNNLTVARNAKTIAGDASDFVLDADLIEIELTYNATTADWEVSARGYR